MFGKCRFRTALAAIAFVVAPTASFAGTVDLGTSNWRASWDNSLDAFVQVVFIDQPNSTSVRIQKIAEFLPPPNPGDPISPIDITFLQTGPTAVNTLIIDQEVITNSTNLTWLDFHFDIVDSGDATFDPVATAGSGGPPPIGFSIAPFTTAVFGNNGGGPNTTLDLAGGAVPSGTVWSPGSGPGGDGALYVHMVPHATAPFTVWTLKERPTIPEPSTLALVAVGGFALLRRKY